MEEQKSSGQMKNLCWVFSSFRDSALEKLYQSFSVRQKRAGLECFLITAILFDIYMLVVPSDQDFVIIAVMGTFLIVNSFLLIWCKKGFQNKPLWTVVPHIAFHIANTQILAGLFLKKNEVTPRDSLGWFLLLTYLIYVTLPLRLPFCVLLSIGTFTSYIVSLCGLTKSQLHFVEQQVSNCILLVTANILGLTSYLVEDKQQRRAFLETRQSLEMKLVIEEQSAEQERLLLSVLPEHVAVQMRQDLDQADSQFKKIYMSRHENVSILYADIVGFTAISSTYSAQELVKMLNELFARFDKLAEKYQQLRIKILGDCYYCISGAPRERPDHAVLCVHMGLSMVKAIKYVQQTANSPVDMRVGIHTGAVLAGVLGQRQWQFDVYSKDVELANKMESSGMAGRVHISATTYSFLNGEFEVEPGYGEKREEALRIAGLKTYFIVKVLKPFQPPVTEVQNGSSILPEEDSCVIAEISDTKDGDVDDGNQKRSREDSRDFKIRLRTELVNRDGHKELSKNTTCLTLNFVDEKKEKLYQQQVETFSSITLLMFLVVRLSIGLTVFTVLPRDMSINISYCTENVIIIVLVSILICDEFLPLKCWNAFKDSVTVRRILSAICVFLLGTVNLIDTISCVQFHSNDNCTFTDDINSSCLYPSYFSYFAVLILIASSLPACLSYLWKALFLFIIALAQCLVNIFVLELVLECEESRKNWKSLTKGKYTLSALLLIATLALAFLARHMEQVARVLFLWRCEVEEQRDFAEDMRRRNEALVYNILPPHVAAHFMGNRKRQHDELYSQSYAEIGVLFASMPNFSDFYSEETVNNQGLECLRFLNEVISDFDALLELPQFQDIIKIKTIGSTYMAASGLNPTRQVKPDDPITVRWAHLALLVEFALELKKALQGINEQSFNHFVLKLGINHGPITAGVIGARKPHYDIWGNTVNVASRMESTGKAGCIQVTEETCEILQHFGYQFEQRGLVAVKGKGQLMTYYLLGKAGKITPPTAPVSPIIGVTAMETVNEEDESHDSPTSKSEDKTVIECTDQKIEDEVFTTDTEQNFSTKEAEPLLQC
ncbi:adenylate cyclase type 3 [Tribolium castaneum]|uniref:adenylate cyclase n=1 Tax=Tribolium castaneum TaxID=7070 RepID=D6WK82_TRICA|nr:PREDICTED: adenylate cyclase type 3 [Tribolium castaneum]EFA03954.2 Adenylate cyclase type 8-like Protein [Tribolium castaneum]|eukprot:XP_001810222.1 PREDICTED: adenylate cyclase type 3 [Tribolium castaneum]